MKKTTWVIIGLSLCVVVLATALGVVLLQTKTETIIVRESDPYISSVLFSKPWQKFTLAPRPIEAINPNGLKGLDVRYSKVGPAGTYSITYSIKKEDKNR